MVFGMRNMVCKKKHHVPSPFKGFHHFVIRNYSKKVRILHDEAIVNSDMLIWIIHKE